MIRPSSDEAGCPKRLGGMSANIPTLSDGAVSIRPIRLRDARVLERELASNRDWLRQWEATNPDGPVSFDTRAASGRCCQRPQRRRACLRDRVRRLFRRPAQRVVDRVRLALVGDHRLLGGRRFAGRNVTPTAVALATDHVFFSLGLHRMEICIRPENAPSLRVTRSSASATRGCGAGSSTSTATGATTSASRSPSRSSRRACCGAGRTQGAGRGGVPEADQTAALHPIRLG